MSTARIFAILGVAAAAWGLVPPSPAALAQVVVARVNGAAITQDALDRRHQDVLRERQINVARLQHPAKARELRREAFDRLLLEELFWQQARAQGLVVDEATLDRAIAATAAQYRTREAFERQLARQGQTEAGYREHARRLLSAERYAESVARGGAQVTDADVEAFYRANPQLFSQPERLRLRRIAVAKGPAAAAGSAPPRERIEALRAELVAGADFDRLARASSDDPTRQWGGALDPVTVDELDGWMRGAVEGLAPGGLSPVVETESAYYVVRLDARMPAGSVPLEQARAGIREQLAEARGREAIERKVSELRNAASVEMLVPL